MEADRQTWENVRKWAGAVLPALCLLVLGFMGDPETGAQVAGAISLVAMVWAGLKLAGPHPSYLRVAANLLTSTSSSIALLLYGFTGSWVMGVAFGLSVCAAGLVLLFRDDLVVVVTVGLGWMAMWAFLLIGIDNWRAASIWGGGIAVFAAVVFSVGRLVDGYGLRSVSAALVCAGPPLGLVAWGATVDWRSTILVWLLPTVAGVAGLIFTQDYSNDEL